MRVEAWGILLLRPERRGGGVTHEVAGKPGEWDYRSLEKGVRWQRMRWSDGITDSMGMNLNKLRETVEDRGDWRVVVHRVAENKTRLGD